MKQSIHLPAVGLLALLTVACGEASSPPDFRPLQGAPTHISDYAGRWIFINYWADWCKPCLEEIPELNQFHARHTGKRAEVFGVNYDAPPPEQLQALATRLDIRFPVLQEDPAAVLENARPEVMPTTYVIGPQGKLRGTLLGPQSAETLEEVLATGTAGE